MRPSASASRLDFDSFAGGAVASRPSYSSPCRPSRKSKIASVYVPSFSSRSGRQRLAKSPRAQPALLLLRTRFRGRTRLLLRLLAAVPQRRGFRIDRAELPLELGRVQERAEVVAVVVCGSRAGGVRAWGQRLTAGDKKEGRRARGWEAHRASRLRRGTRASRSSSCGCE